jgi:hypothetical protein
MEKRILSVTLRTMQDDSPDTSYLGEYSNRAESEFSIDRKHSTDCNTQDYSPAKEIAGKLDRAASYLNSQLYGESPDYAPAPNFEDLESAIELLTEAADEVRECNCGNSGDMGRNEYRFFNPCHENYKGEERENIVKYCLQDYERMESLNNGNWCYLGIRAEAEVQTSNIVQEITSGGLWGIESNSGKEFIKETEQEELSQLRKELLALGFSRHQVYRAFKRTERKEA